MNAVGRTPSVLVVSHPAVLPSNQLVYAEMQALGHSVYVVVPDSWHHDYAAVPLEPTPLPALENAYKALPVFFAGREQRHLYRANTVALLRAARPTVVFCEQEPFSVSALQWGASAFLLGIPFGVQMDENLDRHLPFPARAIRAFVLRRAAFIAARSEAAASLAHRWGARGQVSLIPHHVPGWEPPARAPHKGFVIGYAGRLVPSKGIDVLVGAVRELGAGVELLVVGGGPMRDWLLAADLGAATLRLIEGTANENMPGLYAEMDVLVLPSRTTPKWTEQFGRVLVEALICGTPVIGSESGEIPWVVDVTRGGLTFPEGDVDALIQQLRRMREDPVAARAFAAAGAVEAGRLFSVSAVADGMSAVVAKAAPIRANPSGKPVVALIAHGVHDQGGMERACAELIRGLPEIDFVVVSARLAEDLRMLVSKWIRVNVPSRPIPLKFLCFWLVAGMRVARLQIDLIHSVGAVIPNRVDLVSVHLCHLGYREATGSLAPTNAPRIRRINSAISRKIGILAERWCYRPGRVRTLAAVSGGLAAELQRHFPEIPVATTHNGVNLERFHPDPEKRKEIRNRYGVSDNQVVGIFVGSDWDHKGLAILIESLEKVHQGDLNLLLWVVGGGDRARFKGLAASLGVDHAVRFFGIVDEVEQLYQAADFYVSASLYETFSLVAFEAAATQLPLIVPAISGAMELVKGERGGILVERDSESISAAMMRLASDASLRRRMGSGARDMAADFTWQRSVGSVGALYASLLKTPQ